MLLHIPRAGAWLLWLKDPRHLVLVLAGLLVLLGIEAPTVRWRTGVRARRSPMFTGPPTELSGLRASDVALPLAVALAFGAIAGVAWSRPEARPGTEPVPYHERMSFDYTTPVAPSMVYPDGVVRTGEPIFLNLVSAINVTAHFSFATTARHTPLTGRMAETVSLVYGTGWSTLLEQVAAVPLRSSQGTATVPVNLARMAQVLGGGEQDDGRRGRHADAGGHPGRHFPGQSVGPARLWQLRTIVVIQRQQPRAQPRRPSGPRLPHHFVPCTTVPGGLGPTARAPSCDYDHNGPIGRGQHGTRHR